MTAQAFTLADGSLRYYVRCAWQIQLSAMDPLFALAAWINPNPALHIVGVETKTSSYGFESATPRLMNVLDLGDGRTAVIISSSGEDSGAVSLYEYADGGIRNMHELQSLAAGE